MATQPRGVAASGAKSPGRGSAATEWNVWTRTTKAVRNEWTGNCNGAFRALPVVMLFATEQASQARKAVGIYNAEPLGEVL